MRLVVDANVLISALAKDGAVRAALRTTTDDVTTPWYIRVELEAHQTEIRQKSGLSSQAFEALLGAMWEYIDVVPHQAMRPHLQEAARAMHAYDPDDTLYVAAALAVDGTVVSNDQAFEKQRTVPHMWTSEFVERALGLNDEE
jgi:predicted nucleic acid-binding protein